MAIDSETSDVSLRQRKTGNLSNQSSSSDLLNNNNNEKFVDAYEQEPDFDAHTTTLDPALSNELKSTTEHLPHDEALSKLKEVGAKTPILPSQIGTDFNFKRAIVWKNAIGFLALHLCAVVGVVIGLLGYAKLYTHIYSKYTLQNNMKIWQMYSVSDCSMNFLFSLLSTHFAVWMWIRCYNGCP